MRLTIPTSLIRLAKPLLRVHLGLYRREVASAPYPVDEPEYEVAGTDPDRLAFIGSIAVSGFGVLRHGMKTSSQVAQRVAAARLRGCTWSEVTSPTLTASNTMREKTLVPQGTRAAVILLGITDVLLGTAPCEWARDLDAVVERIRDESGVETAIVLAGVPPMTEFRAIPPVAARLLTRQIDALNTATAAFACDRAGVTYVPFPVWDVGALFIQDALSWATMHRLWAKAIAPAVIEHLEGAPATAATTGASAGASTVRSAGGSTGASAGASTVRSAGAPAGASVSARAAAR
ncbi:hypothetical protein AX769_00410 [Frondihabitans sp. PAMC 28766]|uniref:GDSL-type esterase/lipase family protein n=1 Tax=Frondihabitans sp. PAMC 28766 TaxID=1795630 RepID=UPI00078D0536|nr:GDSL-type esterase/lipase family protein [Frondihabitans sp. PAMC 28766]AMM18881.1 hypothetical protein AX769_00410 [Frondihabitans sp. PAMC 28766]